MWYNQNTKLLTRVTDSQNNELTPVDMNDYITGGSPSSNTWYEVAIPFSAFGATSTIQSILFLSPNTTTIYLDNVQLTNSATSTSTASSTLHFIHTDHLGGTNVTTNSEGEVVQVLDYYPFGGERINSGSISTDRQYIGERYDEETELNYLNARYYESTRGQFLSQDSVFWELNQDLTDPQSLNSYSYAENNPIVKSDPSGRCVGPLVAACIGAGGGLVAQFGADIYNNVQAGGWSNAFSNFSSGETYLTRAAQGFAIGLTGGAASGLGIAGQVAVVGGASGAAGVAGNWYLGESITLQSVAADTIIGGATFGAGKFVPGLPGRNPNFRTNAFYFGRHTQQSAMKLGIEGISGYTSLIVGSHNFSNTSASGGSPASQGAAKALGIGNTGSGSFVGTYNFGSGVGTYDFGSDKWVSTAQSTPAVK